MSMKNSACPTTTRGVAKIFDRGERAVPFKMEIEKRARENLTPLRWIEGKNKRSGPGVNYGPRGGGGEDEGVRDDGNFANSTDQTLFRTLIDI